MKTNAQSLSRTFSKVCLNVVVMSGTTIFVAIALSGVVFFIRFFVALCRENRTAKCRIVNLTDEAPRRSTGAAVLRMPLQTASRVETESTLRGRSHFGGSRA